MHDTIWLPFNLLYTSSPFLICFGQTTVPSETTKMNLLQSTSESLTRPLRLISMTLMLCILSACATPDTQRFQTDPTKAQTSETIRTIYANRTMLTQSFHGTQIEYLDESGISHLWYPGNFRGVPARWEARLDNVGHDICWKYPSSSYNPLTGLSGGSWECTPDRSYYPRLVQIIEGDPFGLHSGRVPFRLGGGKFSAEELAAQASIPARNVRVLYNNR
jgi:hypothetical protein